MSTLRKTGQYKRACAVVILHNGTGGIILGRSLKHGDWELPGGKHELNETSRECAVRECIEECGVGLTTHGLEFICITESERSLCVNYSMLVPASIIPTVMEPKKHSEWKWFSIRTLPKSIRPECQEVIKAWLERKSEETKPAPAEVERSGKSAT